MGLNLTRREGEKVCIGDDVVLTLGNIFRDKAGNYAVNLNFDAPHHIQIDREEIRDKKGKEGTRKTQW